MSATVIIRKVLRLVLPKAQDSVGLSQAIQFCPSGEKITLLAFLYRIAQNLGISRFSSHTAGSVMTKSEPLKNVPEQWSVINNNKLFLIIILITLSVSQFFQHEKKIGDRGGARELGVRTMELLLHASRLSDSKKV